MVAQVRLIIPFAEIPKLSLDIRKAHIAIVAPVQHHKSAFVPHLALRILLRPIPPREQEHLHLKRPPRRVSVIVLQIGVRSIRWLGQVLSVQCSRQMLGKRAFTRANVAFYNNQSAVHRSLIGL